MHSRRRTHSEAAEPVDRWATRCRSQELRHGFLFSRSVRQGDNTGVDLVCTYRKEPSSPDLDRVGLYHEVSNKTSAITHLGPYSLDRTSLYVNGEQGHSCCLPPAASSGPPPSPHAAPAHDSLSSSRLQRTASDAASDAQ